MRARCLTVSNPFDPLGSRRMVELRRPVRVRALAPRGTAPVIALLNGRALLRAGWRRRLADGDMLVFAVLPRGGAGGSNPLRLLLSVALMAFAGVAAGAIFGVGAAELGTTATLFGSFTIGQATALGIVLAGSAAINALLPVPKPFTLPAASPTYSLQAQGNTARLEQPIPVHYGRILAWPDFAAMPYTDYAGNDQYLYQLLCLGAGEFEIEEIRVEDTPITAFAEVETEIIAPGGHGDTVPDPCHYLGRSVRTRTDRSEDRHLCLGGNGYYHHRNRAWPDYRADGGTGIHQRRCYQRGLPDRRGA